MKKTKNNKADRKAHSSLDSFLQGNIAKNTKSKTKPKIRIPKNSGFLPYLNPKCQKFLYPLNPQFRQYQFSICCKCVCYNTLVCLPTGLGKTHVASVLMMNYSRWFIDGKIFFLAPTKPLVFQQKNSLKNFHEFIGQDNITQMNGNVPAKKRQKLYEEKKIFFATPQTFENDLRQNRIPIKKIVLIIFDEAHRAVGNYSYAKIVKIMEETQIGYRIVGLSATPGNVQEKIQEVITNLLISKLQVKDQSDPDVSKYLFAKQIKEVLIKPTSIISHTDRLLAQFLIQPFNHLISLGLIDRYVVKTQSFFPIMLQFNQRIENQNIKSKEKSLAFSSLKFIKFIYDSRKSLRDQGYQTFRIKFLSQLNFHPQNEKQKKDNSNSISKTTPNSISLGYWKKLNENQEIQKLKDIFKKNTIPLHHPKLQKLKEMLEEFFKRADTNAKSKAMIFVQFRATALQIKKYLHGSDLIKCQIFHGQSKTKILNTDYQQINEGSKIFSEDSQFQTLSLNQKEQLSLIKKFQTHQVNTLISTSVGEEGLDIGQVDCIFCYDGGMSPIRMIQRMGRTGRKRDGKVFVMLMEGKEHLDYLKGKKKSTAMKNILKEKVNNFKYNAFNSVLFPQQQQIEVEMYDNVIKNQVFSSDQEDIQQFTQQKSKQQSIDSKEYEILQKQNQQKVQLSQVNQDRKRYDQGNEDRKKYDQGNQDRKRYEDNISFAETFDEIEYIKKDPSYEQSKRILLMQCSDEETSIDSQILIGKFKQYCQKKNYND